MMEYVCVALISIYGWKMFNLDDPTDNSTTGTISVENRNYFLNEFKMVNLWWFVAISFNEATDLVAIDGNMNLVYHFQGLQHCLMKNNEVNIEKDWILQRERAWLVHISTQKNVYDLRTLMCWTGL